MRGSKRRAWRPVEGRRLVHWGRSLATALSFLAGGAVLVAQPASAANNGSFSIAPAGTSSHQRTYFTPVLSVGVPASDSVVVVNETTKPLTLDLYASDAYNTKSGAFALQPNYKPKQGMGAWIHLPVSKVTVPARSGQIIPFTYNPPANVAPGDYSGGIVAEEATGAVTKSGAVRVQSLQAVGTAVYGRMLGPLHPRLVVSSISLKATTPFAAELGGSVNVTVTYSITNTGNENLKPQVTVSLSPLLGSGPAVEHVKLPQVLPGSTVTFSHTFDDVVPFGHLAAKVVAHTLGAQGSGTAGTVVVPWGLVGIVALLILLLYYRSRRRNRRRPKPGGAQPDPGPDGAEAAATVGSGGAGALGS